MPGTALVLVVQISEVRFEPVFFPVLKHAAQIPGLFLSLRGLSFEFLNFSGGRVRRVQLLFRRYLRPHLLGAFLVLFFAVFSVIAFIIRPPIGRRCIAWFWLADNANIDLGVRGHSNAKRDFWTDPVIRDRQCDHVDVAPNRRHFPLDVVPIDAPELLVGTVRFLAGNAVVSVDASVAVGIQLAGVVNRIARSRRLMTK